MYDESYESYCSGTNLFKILFNLTELSDDKSNLLDTDCNVGID